MAREGNIKERKEKELLCIFPVTFRLSLLVASGEAKTPRPIIPAGSRREEGIAREERKGREERKERAKGEGGRERKGGREEES